MACRLHPARYRERTTSPTFSGAALTSSRYFYVLPPRSLVHPGFSLIVLCISSVPGHGGERSAGGAASGWVLPAPLSHRHEPAFWGLRSHRTALPRTACSAGTGRRGDGVDFRQRRRLHRVHAARAPPKAAAEVGSGAGGVGQHGRRGEGWRGCGAAGALRRRVWAGHAEAGGEGVGGGEGGAAARGRGRAQARQRAEPRAERGERSQLEPACPGSCPCGTAVC
jgi:hypothetical protein